MNVKGGIILSFAFYLALARAVIPIAKAEEGGKESKVQEEVAKVKAYLVKNYKGEKYEQGPSIFQGEALKIAYASLRFYAVHVSSKPVEKAGDPHLNLVLSLDEQGDIREIKTPADYKNGLMQIKSEADAKTAAAAIMTLHLGPFGPVPEIRAGAVTVTPEGKDFSCSASVQAHTFLVRLDREGRCTTAEYKFSGPRPICFGGLFLALENADRRKLGLAEERGALLCCALDSDSVGAHAGLRVGDALIGFNGRPLPAQDALGYLRGLVVPLKKKGNSNGEVEILRLGQTLKLTVYWP